MKNNRVIYLLLIVLLIWNIVLTISLSSVKNINYTPATTTIKNVNITGFTSDITKVVENIKTSNVVVDGFNSLSSGFIYGYDEDNIYIISSYHAISDSPIIEVILGNNQKLQASLINHDIYLDLALLAVDRNVEVNSVDRGDATLLKDGEFVFMVGTPSNIELSNSLALGLVSSNRRTISNLIRVDDKSYDYYLDDIQLSSNITNGYSGSAVYNNAGEVVGVITFSSNRGEVFATPINEVEKFYENSFSKEPLDVLPLNIKGEFICDMELYLKNSFGINLEINSGLYVEDIKLNSLLRDADVKKGDVILKIQDEEIDNYKDLLDIKYSDLSELKVQVYRDGEIIDLVGEIDD